MHRLLFKHTRILLAGILLSMQLVSTDTQAQLISFNPATSVGFGASPWTPPAVLSPALTTAGLIRGSSIATGGSPAAGCYGGSGGWSASGLDANSFYFTISASCHVVSISSIAGYTRRSSTGPNGCNIYYSLGGGPYVLVGNWVTTSTSGTTGTTGSTTLSGVTALQNIPAGTTIKFIINPTGTTGNWYFTNTSLAVNGTAVAVIAPTITTPPASVAIPVATGTSFSVSGVSGAASYQWQRNTSGIVGGTWVDITSATMDPTGTYSGYTTTSTATSNTLTLTSVPAGWDGYGYRCVVTNCAGTTTSAPALLNVISVSCSGTPAAGTAVPAAGPFCGSGSTTITLSGGSTGSGLTYQWSSSTSSTPPGTAIPGATLSSYTTPSLTNTTYYWCTSTCAISGLSNISATGVVSVNPLPSVSAPGGNVCAGGTGISITASGASTYTWSPGTGLSATTGATVTANPVMNTTYTITGTSAAGCSSTTTALVTYNVYPGSVSIAPSPIAACQGSAPQLLTATGGLIGPTTTGSGTITIPATIASSGTIANTINVAGIPAGAVITGAAVNVVNFGSQYQDDYIFNITAPNGNILNLIKQRGTHTSTVTTLFSNTNLSSAGSTSLATGSGAFTGTWLADANAAVGGAPYVSNVTTWSSLYSIPNGPWTLSIFNNTAFSNIVVPSAEWSITLTYSYQAPVTWSPLTSLYTDAAGTIPYTGTATSTVYFNPATIAATTYTATATNATCTSTANVLTTVNPVPAAITGVLNVCQTGTTALASTTAGGTWTSSNTNASVGATTGVVTGVTSGTSVITYTITGGCYVTAIMTINTMPPAIGGTAIVCEGATTTLTNAAGGGTWSISNTNAGIVPTTGVATGNTAGTSIVTYQLTGSCQVTTVLTTNPSPGTITGSLNVCSGGSTTTLGNPVAGGSWASSNANATVDAVTGGATGVTAGTSVISYTLPAGCFTTTTLTINLLPPAITGTFQVCETATTALGNPIAGGTWSISNTNASIDAVTGVVTGITAGTSIVTYQLTGGCIATTTITVNAMPGAITGTLLVCEGGSVTVLGNPITGGTWSSSNANATAGLLSGFVTGVTAGTATISYILPGNCGVAATVTVNQLPTTIAGPTAVCQATSVTLTSSPLGGTWSCSNANASINSSTGSLTGVTTGTSTVTYTLPTGCVTTRAENINTTPAPISGPSQVCVVSMISLGNTVPGGTWTSSSSNATIGVSGIVSGVTAGTAVITYTLSTGCKNSTVITVNALPVAVSGSAGVCVGYTTSLSSSPAGGTWTANNGNCSVNATTGVVTGISVGATLITYTLPTGCVSGVTVTVNSLPAAITGTTQVCVGATQTLSSATTGGTWSSSNTSRVTVNIATGVMTGVSPGSANISYTLGSGCVVATTVNVNPNPPTIGSSGPTQFCPGSGVTLSNSFPGGTWSTSSPTIATVDAVTGVVSGIVGGSARITYTLPTGCYNTAFISVNPSPSAITGLFSLCTGNTTMLYSGTPGGVWISSNTSVATVVASGLLSGATTGITAGTVSVTYTLPTGCFAETTMTINSSPANIGGSPIICLGSSTSLSNAVAGGVWSSSNTGTAPVSLTGSVSGIGLGTAIISYTLLPSGCYRSKTVTVSALPSPFAVTGGGNYCSGSSGSAIGLAGSQMSKKYELVYGTSVVGTLYGTGTGISFGPYTVPGAYNVLATDTTTGCQSMMTGSVSISVVPLVMPSVSVTASSGDTLCSGHTLSYTAVAANGGSLPSYVWRKNGVVVSTAGTFSFTPANGDVIYLKMTSNATCRILDTAVTAHTITVIPTITPEISLAVYPNDTVCSLSTVNYLSAGVGGGTSPIYIWKINGTVAGSGAGTTLTDIPADNDNVRCVMISNIACRTADTVYSNILNMKVLPPVTPVVSISAVPGLSVKTGTTVTFTANAANSGTTPAYQWAVNSSIVPGATAATFTSSTLNDNDMVSCIVTSSGMCGGVNTEKSVQMRITTGIAEQNMLSTIQLIPNPNSGTFSITGIPQPNSGDISLTVCDVLGQVVYTRSVKASAAEEVVELNNTLANGMYIINIKSADESKALHFIIKR